MNEIERALRLGDFTVKPQLRELLFSEAESVNPRWPSLFASVATHDEVSALAELVETLTRPESVRRAVVSLGLTLSPAAIPFLWQIRDDFDDSELDPFVAMALETILGAGEEEADVSDPDTRRSLETAASTLDKGQYYYRGTAVFPGEMAKELISSAAVSRTEKRKIALVYQGDLLASFSGVEPPVARGQVVDDQGLQAVLAYVKEIAAMSWKRGWKYYFGHPVGGRE